MANAAGHSSTQAARATVLAPGQLAPPCACSCELSRTEGQITVLSPPHAAQAVTEPSRLGPRPLAFYLGQAAAAPEPATARERFLRGVRAYWAHPYRRRPTESRLLWRQGSARLLDVGGEGPPVLVIPSLINRAEILDLLPGRSLLAYLAASGYRPLLLDWGVPRGRELRFTLSDHIHGRAAGALDAVLEVTDRKPILLGYCLGGLLATALAAARPDDLAGLAVLATPWAFRTRPTAARAARPRGFDADRHPGIRAGRSSAGLVRPARPARRDPQVCPLRRARPG